MAGTAGRGTRMKPSPWRIFAIIVGSYTLLLVLGTLFEETLGAVALVLVVVPYFSVLLMHKAGLPGVLEHEGLCGWGWCAPTPLGWALTAVLWLGLAWGLSLAIAALLRNTRGAT